MITNKTLLQIFTLLVIILNLYIGLHGQISIINILCGLFLIFWSIKHNLYS
jgi:hypothetical protein